MTLYIQHGYGKSDKIDNLASMSEVGGVVLSPKDEAHPTLRATAESARGLGLRVLVDPQSYIYSTEPAGFGRNHESNHLPTARISWAQDAAAVTGLVEAVGGLNDELATDVWIAPAPLQSFFVDEMTPLALQYARTAAGSWRGNPIYASLVIDQHAFASWETAERWLTAATTLDVQGFYIVIAKSTSSYPQPAWDAGFLANFLRLVYILTEVAGFEVVLGYTDVEGALGVAVGATAMSTGWSYSLRQLCPDRWKTVQEGGAPPVSRVNMERIWSPVRAEADAAPVFDSAHRDMAFTPREIEEYEGTAFKLDRPTAQVRHLEVLARRIGEVAAAGDVSSRLDLVAARLDSATTVIRALNQQGFLTGEPYYGRVDAMRQALIRFRSAEGA